MSEEQDDRLNMPRIPEHLMPTVTLAKGEDIMRVAELGPFTVALISTRHTDTRGQTGLRVIVWGSDQEVCYDTGSAQGGLVYGSPMHADDSDQAMLGAINLVVHDATHDNKGNPVYAAWDTETLEVEAYMAWEEES